MPEKHTWQKELPAVPKSVSKRHRLADQFVATWPWADDPCWEPERPAKILWQVEHTVRPTGAVRVHLTFGTSTTGDLLAELRETVAGPLGKKLTNQLKRAKDLGYPTMLALDQVGLEALPGGTAWLPSAHAVATVVTELCEAHPGVLDAALLATHTGELVQVFGSHFGGGWSLDTVPLPEELRGLDLQGPGATCP